MELATLGLEGRREGMVLGSRVGSRLLRVG